MVMYCHDAKPTAVIIIIIIIFSTLFYVGGPLVASFFSYSNAITRSILLPFSGDSFKSIVLYYDYYYYYLQIGGFCVISVHFCFQFLGDTPTHPPTRPFSL